MLAAEKRVTSPLLIPSSIEKVAEIDEHVGCAMSGLTADARTLIDHGRTQVRGGWRCRCGLRSRRAKAREEKRERGKKRERVFFSFFFNPIVFFSFC